MTTTSIHTGSPDLHARVGRRVLGILGGMGPAATADFLCKLVKATPAQRDEDHIPTVTCSFPQIPGRTEALLNGGSTPLPSMLDVLSLLERCGAQYVAIPCNTAHYWYRDLQAATRLPILHIVDATMSSVRAAGLERGSLGLLATTATVAARIYADRLSGSGFDCLIPENADQSLLMDVMQAVKAGRADSSTDLVVRGIAGRLMQRGADLVILGNSELPLALDSIPPWCLDSTGALARACVLESEN